MLSQNPSQGNKVAGGGATSRAAATALASLQDAFRGDPSPSSAWVMGGGAAPSIAA